jgi:hypothetical protein
MEKLGLLRAIDSISKNNAFNGLFPTASWYQLVLKLASMLFTGRDDRFHNIFHSLDVWHKALCLSGGTEKRHGYPWPVAAINYKSF